MGRYLDFAYRDDTYGERNRDAIPVRIVDLGYETNDAGDTVPNIVVEVGPMSWEPTNFECSVCLAAAKEPCRDLPSPKTHPERIRAVKVGVMRSYTFFPPDPDRLRVEQEANGNDTSTDFLLSPDEQLSGAVLTYRSGMDPLGPVAPGSVLYVSVYVAEQFRDKELGEDIWLPWDLRGRAWAVIPDNYGGCQAGPDSMPRGVMTGGRIYGEHIMNPQTLFMRTMGYLLDTVVTDGELMTRPAASIHPNMVFPLLRGFGMSESEESLLADRTVRHRSKHVLAHYNEISTMKGTKLGLTRYVEAVTGMPSMVVGPVNLILDRVDTCPDDPKLFANTAGRIDPSKGVGGTAQVMGAGNGQEFVWEAVPSINCIDGYTGSITPARAPVSPHRENGTDPDPWYDAKSPEPATRWVHRFTYAGTMEYGPPAITSYLPKATPGETYSFRFRVYPETGLGPVVSAKLTFFDRYGEQLSQVDLGARRASTQNAWNDFSSSKSAVAPAGTKYVQWRIFLGNGPTFTAPGTGANVSVRLGALQLAVGKPRLYRDPRAMALMIDTGPGATATGPVMDDPAVKMNDATTTMNEGTILSGGSLDTFEKVLIAKMKAVLPRYLPAGVGIELFTSDDVEYAPYTNSDRL